MKKKIEILVNATFLSDNRKVQLIDSIWGIIRSIPDSDTIRYNARSMDEKEFDEWWWENVYKEK